MRAEQTTGALGEGIESILEIVEGYTEGWDSVLADLFVILKFTRILIESSQETGFADDERSVLLEHVNDAIMVVKSAATRQGELSIAEDTEIIRPRKEVDWSVW